MLADWDARLIEPERALYMAGDWPVYYTFARSSLAQFEQEDRAQIYQRCGRCHQSITALATTTEVPVMRELKGPQTTPADQLSDVLRHMVTAHDWSLSGGIQHGR